VISGIALSIVKYNKMDFYNASLYHYLKITDILSDTSELIRIHKVKRKSTLFRVTWRKNVRLVGRESIFWKPNQS